MTAKPPYCAPTIVSFSILLKNKNNFNLYLVFYCHAVTPT